MKCPGEKMPANPQDAQVPLLGYSSFIYAVPSGLTTPYDLAADFFFPFTWSYDGCKAYVLKNSYQSDVAYGYVLLPKAYTHVEGFHPDQDRFYT